MRKILVVDDEKSVVEMIGLYLESEGYQVIGTTDSTKAEEILQHDYCPIVISDIVMPVKDGVQLLRDIKSREGLTEVILMTGYVTMGNIIEAYRNGASNIIFKPFDRLEVLLDAVKYCESKIDRVNDVLKNLVGMKNQHICHHKFKTVFLDEDEKNAQLQHS